MADGGVPEGWYPDPADGSSERWWDGHQWTGARRPVASGSPASAAAPPAAGAASRGARRRVLAVGALIAIIALGAVALVATLGGEPGTGLAAGDTDLPNQTVPGTTEQTVPGTTEPGPAAEVDPFPAEVDPAPQDAPLDSDPDAGPAPELPGMADAVVHRPTDWIAFGELPGDWRYEDFFVDPVDRDADYFFGETDLGRIEISAGSLHEMDLNEFAEAVDMTSEAALLETVALEGPVDVAVRGGLDGVQWWGQHTESMGGMPFSALAVDLGDQWAGVYVAYSDSGVGAAGSPTRDEVDAWLGTIRIDPAEVRAVLEAS